MRVPRYDYYSLRPATVMPNTGFLLCEGVVAKEGVLRYEDMDGTIRRELVTKEDTFTPASLATLPLTKFTEEHPPEPITPENTTEFGRGTVLEELEFHNGFVKIRFVVDSAGTIKAINEDGLTELSPGYEVELIERSGIHPVFGPFDFIQGPRFYNHVAGTRGARGGHDVRFRTDSGLTLPPGFAWQLREDTVWPEDDDAARPYNLSTGKTKMPQVNLDGISFEVPDMGTAQAINSWRKDQEEAGETMSGDLGKAKELIASHQTMIDELTAGRDEMQGKIDELTGQLEAVTSGTGPAPLNGDDEDLLAAQKAEDAPPANGPPTDDQDDPEVMNQDSFLKLHNERLELEPLAKRFQVDSVEKLRNPELKKAIVVASKITSDDLATASPERIDGLYSGLKIVIGTRDASYHADSVGVVPNPAPNGSGGGIMLPTDQRTPQQRMDAAKAGYRDTLTRKQQPAT